MEYQEDNADRKRKIRIITVFCVAAVIMLGIGAWAIVSAINSVSNVVEVATTKEVKKTEPATNNTKVSSTNSEGEEVSVSENVSEATTEETAPAVNVETESLPSTGPTSLLATALLMGVSAYLVMANRNMIAKHQ